MGRYGSGKECQRRGRRRRRLVEAQGGLCAYCFGPMRNRLRVSDGRMEDQDATMDEVVPYCQGGRLLRNSVAVHYGCNRRKDDRAPTGCELVALAWVNGLIGED